MFNIMRDPDSPFPTAPPKAAKAGWPAGRPLIVVSVPAQRAALLLPPGRWNGPWPVSTAAAGTGNEPGSHRTPTGLHRVCERIGEGSPPGTEFISRAPTGRILDADGMRAAAGDLVLTRILRLDGLQPGINDRSKARFIYLHGTNREADLGSPASHGCIRMANDDILRLFHLLRLHPSAFCWIE